MKNDGTYIVSISLFYSKITGCNEIVVYNNNSILLF